MLNKAGVWGVEKFNKCFVFEQDPIEARRVPLLPRASGRAAMLDWDKTHSQISPADPKGTKPLKPGYGTLRDVFYRHRAELLLKTFGVQSLDLVISAAEVAEYADRSDVAEKIRDMMWRCHQYAVVETLNVSRRPAMRRPGQDLLQHLCVRLGHRDGRLPAARVVDGQAVVQDPGRRRDRHARRTRADEEGEGGRLERRRARVRQDGPRDERECARRVDAQDRIDRIRLATRRRTWTPRRPGPTAARSWSCSRRTRWPKKQAT